MLKIDHLVVQSIEEKQILNGVNLKINENEIHVIMGPNGAGKSTICKSIMHHPSYKIISGNIFFEEDDITKVTPYEVAKKGIYYINQTPIEIEGITNAELYRTALIDNNRPMDIFAFNKKCNEICKKLELPKSFLHRNVNEGMSGGERKKNELLGMWLLEPKFVIFDEIDSGLDVDALKIVGENILEYQEQTKASVLIITHQQKLIDMLKPQFVHIMRDGVLIKSGDITLAKEIEKNGFSNYFGANEVSENRNDE